MGVPKFYRWISERYPCLSEVVKEYQIPEFDNLYLDMNGIIHMCSHPEDDNPHFRITEEKIFEGIFHYIEVLFRMIRPKKVFFMAIDGVAPRAKMNQQRGRRFRSAREAEDLIRKALEKGEVLPTEQRFDSNCITPGTPFMVRLHQQLQYFVTKKITTDSTWKGVRVILSGHETPGEGEHKIMDFIRYEKCKPGYDPNTRHCLYGLDADLIMLGLITHEPHFSLLREEVRFGGKNSQKRSSAPEETTFHLLHLSLMREYLDYEFAALKDKIRDYDVEKIIDDWVLMGYLVGNDFIPHLPHIHIHQECLPLLWRTYIEIRPCLDGYLNDDGDLNLPRFEKYLEKLSEHDVEQFRDGYADLKWLEGKIGGKAVNEEAGQAKKSEIKLRKLEKFEGIPTANEFEELMKFDDMDADEEMDYIEEEEEVLDLEDYDSDEQFEMEFRCHKDYYYKEKMNYTKVTPEVLREQAHGYVRALQWILHYYYNGVPSWSWFYPHHYAPHISDVRNFSDMKIEFDIARPFLPFEQLMAVLPAASKNLLPVPLQALMTNDTSPVVDFYPVNFELDLNGKLQEWEAVVLIPFIEEERLLRAMEPALGKMTDEEKARNCHGPHRMYEWADNDLGTYLSTLPGQFPDIHHHHAKETKLHKFEFVVSKDKLKKGLCRGVKLDVYFPGFPTLKHIEHTAKLKKEAVKVFQMNSRGENMMLNITYKQPADLEQVAYDLIGKTIYVGWPHMVEARVVSCSDGEWMYKIKEQHHTRKSYGSAKNTRVGIEYEVLDNSEMGKVRRESQNITNEYHDRRGVEVGRTEIVVYACPMTGRKYICGNHGNITLEKQWSPHPVPYALQATVKDIAVHDSTFKQYRTLDELFPVGSDVFMLGSPHYGAMGQVLDIDPKNDGRIRVDFSILQEPDFEHIMKKESSLSLNYMPGYVIAQRLGINGFLLSRITGTVYVSRGSKEHPSNANKVNVGLNLKSNKKNEEVAGFTKKIEEQWHYSTKALQTVGEYIKEFPELFDFMNQSSNEDTYYEDDIFGENGRVKELLEFIKGLPCASAQRVPQGSDTLDELVVKEIEKEVERVKERNNKKKKRIKMQVRPHLLYRPLDTSASLIPDNSATYEMYDRVINVREGFSVPLGLKGTVIGLFPAPKDEDSIYDVVFDEEFLGGLTIRCSANRGYRMPPYAMVNLSHGERKEQNRSGGNPRKPTAVVKPQTNQYGQNQYNNSYSNLVSKSAPQGNRHQSRYQQQQFNQQLQNQIFQQGGGKQLFTQPPPLQSLGQGGMPYKQGASGYNTTPQRQDQYNQHQFHSERPKNRQERQNQDDFAKIWNQLSAAGASIGGAGAQDTPTGRPAQSRTQQKGNDGSAGPSLQQAAQALQNLPTVKYQRRNKKPRNDDKRKAKNQQNASGQQQPTQQGDMKKIDLGSLFATGGQGTADTASVGADKEGDDFMKLMKALEISTNAKQDSEGTSTKHGDKQKESTAALCQMLKVGSAATEQTADHSSGSEVSNGFGRQVSIQELFQGVQQQQQQQQKTPQKQHVPRQHQHHTPPQNKRSCLENLLRYCQAMGMPAPHYDYHYGDNKRVQAVITFANGQRFQGSWTKNPDEASESAAGQALLTLQAGQGQPHFSPNQPGSQQRFTPSPNSAFTPIKPGGAPNGHQQHLTPRGYQQAPPFANPPFRSPNAPHGHMPHRPLGANFANSFLPQHQFHQYHHQHGYHPGNQHQQDIRHQGHQTHPMHQQHGWAQQHRNHQEQRERRASKSQMEEVAAKSAEMDKTPKKNPFVPLQVQVQQKTPHRDSKKQNSETSTQNSQVTEEKSSTQKSTKESTNSSVTNSGKTVTAKPKAKKVGMAAANDNNSNSETGGKPKVQPKRPKSRIAANFGAPAQ